MRLEWTDNAKRERKTIIGYIWLDNPEAARRMDVRFRSVARLLTHSPYSGRPGAIAGFREFIVHPSYRMVYQIDGETISIVALVHTARQWPPEPDGAEDED